MANRLKVYILGILLGVSSVAFAEVNSYDDFPYTELFTEGKEWTMYHFAASPDPFNKGQAYYTTHYIITVKVDGSKIIKGIDCKRLTIETQHIQGSCNACENWLSKNDQWRAFYEQPVGIPDEVYVYEKDRKIYFYRDPGLKLVDDDWKIQFCEPYFDLYMDLNLGIGDSAPYMGIIDTDELISIDGQYHRRITGSYKDDKNIPEWQVAQWIEGIGGSFGLSMYNEYFWNYFPLALDLQIEYFMLAHVRENGKMLFDQTDVLRSLGLEVPTSTADLSNIDAIDSDSNRDNKCYDLHGRPISKPSRGQLYISNGKIQFCR